MELSVSLMFVKNTSSSLKIKICETFFFEPLSRDVKISNQNDNPELKNMFKLFTMN